MNKILVVVVVVVVVVIKKCVLGSFKSPGRMSRELTNGLMYVTVRGL